MRKQSVLVTSDDGYNAPGLRLLVKLLKSQYQVKVAVTEIQQSGVGAMTHLKNGGKWTLMRVEGEEALCVDGSPVDAVECAQAYYNQSFDLLVSGINWGENIGGSMFASGTVNAAAWGVNNGVANKALAFSWKVEPKYWHLDHGGAAKIPADLIKYPGQTVMKLCKLAIKKQFWGSQMLNINLPTDETNQVRFTVPVKDLKSVYWYPMDIDKEAKTYRYVPDYAAKIKAEAGSDFASIYEGVIAITPCQTTFLDKEAWRKLVKQDLNFEI